MTDSFLVIYEDRQLSACCTFSLRESTLPLTWDYGEVECSVDRPWDNARWILTDKLIRWIKFYSALRSSSYSFVVNKMVAGICALIASSHISDQACKLGMFCRSSLYFPVTYCFACPVIDRVNKRDSPVLCGVAVIRNNATKDCKETHVNYKSSYNLFAIHAQS